VDHAQHSANRTLAADLEPRIQLVPCPAVHPDLSTLAALPVPDENSAAGAVEVALLERERFADPHSGTPKQHNQRSESVAVGAVTNRAHHSDDLVDRRRIRRVLPACATATLGVRARQARVAFGADARRLVEAGAAVRLAAAAALALPGIARLGERGRCDQERDRRISPPPSGKSVRE
jgi:hypothetical protein